MQNEYFQIIRLFLYGRLIALVALAGLLTAILVILTNVLRGPETNDTLATLLGTGIGFIGAGVAAMSVAISRDVTEFIKDILSREKPGD